MEPSESNSAAAVSNGKDPQQQLGGKLQNKLGLKGADEGGAKTGEKVLNVNDDGGVCDEDFSQGEGCDEDENVKEEVSRETDGGRDGDVDGMELNEGKSSGGTPHSPLRSVSLDCVC